MCVLCFLPLRGHVKGISSDNRLLVASVAVHFTLDPNEAFSLSLQQLCSTHTGQHKHMCMHRLTHSRTHTPTKENTHMHAPAYAHSQTHTKTHVHAHAHIQIHTHSNPPKKGNLFMSEAQSISLTVFCLNNRRFFLKMTFRFQLLIHWALGQSRKHL